MNIISQNALDVKSGEQALADLARRQNPFEVVSVGDVVTVKAISIDLERGRIGLSMKEA